MPTPHHKSRDQPLAACCSDARNSFADSLLVVASAAVAVFAVMTVAAAVAADDNEVAAVDGVHQTVAVVTRH